MSKTIGHKTILVRFPVTIYDIIKDMAIKKFNGNVTATIIHIIEQHKNNL